MIRPFAKLTLNSFAAALIIHLLIDLAHQCQLYSKLTQLIRHYWAIFGRRFSKICIYISLTLTNIWDFFQIFSFIKSILSILKVKYFDFTCKCKIRSTGFFTAVVFLLVDILILGQQ